MLETKNDHWAPASYSRISDLLWISSFRCHSSPFQMGMFIVVTLSLLYCYMYKGLGPTYLFNSEIARVRGALSGSIETVVNHPRLLGLELKILMRGTSGLCPLRSGQACSACGKRRDLKWDRRYYCSCSCIILPAGEEAGPSELLLTHRAKVMMVYRFWG